MEDVAVNVICQYAILAYLIGALTSLVHGGCGCNCNMPVCYSGLPHWCMEEAAVIVICQYAILAYLIGAWRMRL